MFSVYVELYAEITKYAIGAVSSLFGTGFFVSGKKGIGTVTVFIISCLKWKRPRLSTDVYC